MARVSAPLGTVINNPYMDEMIMTAKKIATTGKGILASDGSTEGIGAKFDMINLENSIENRRKYREMLYQTPNIEKYLSAIIFSDETFWFKMGGSANGKPLRDIVNEKGICVGINVNYGSFDLPYKKGEYFSGGTDGMIKNAQNYYKNGARFAKLRVPFNIQNGYISQTAIIDGCVLSAKYALLCQSNGLVPILEPDVVMNGNHSSEICKYWTGKIISFLFKTLNDYDIKLNASILKPNMILKGKDNNINGRSFKENAINTIDVLCDNVPISVPGIMFLSGGMCEEEATLNLNEINKLFSYRLNRDNVKLSPWLISFSFGRALQHSTVLEWKGKDENIEKAQSVLLNRCKANSDAQLGNYTGWNMNKNDLKTMRQRGYIIKSKL